MCTWQINRQGIEQLGRSFSSIAGFEPGRAIAPIPHCNWNCPFKKRPREKKTQKKAQTKSFISVQKLQAETERGKYILSHL